MKKITQIEEESTENHACNTSKAAAEEDKEEKRSLAFLLGTNTNASSDETLGSSVTSELNRYHQERSSLQNDPPLLWWKANERRFPILSKIAKKVLAIPATSTPTERLFSTAGLICNKKRARLLAENVDTLVFLHQNRRYLESSA